MHMDITTSPSNLCLNNPEATRPLKPQILKRHQRKICSRIRLSHFRNLHVGNHHAAKPPQKQKLCYTKWGCCTTEVMESLHRKCMLEPHVVEEALLGVGESIESEIGLSTRMLRSVWRHVVEVPRCDRDKMRPTTKVEWAGWVAWPLRDFSPERSNAISQNTLLLSKRSGYAQRQSISWLVRELLKHAIF
jgi:hypothetical protein